MTSVSNLITAATTMAEYLEHKERDDYFQWCEDNDHDPYIIYVNSMEHVYESVIYFRHLAGIEIDPKFIFTEAL